jgi:hypothetical protein
VRTLLSHLLSLTVLAHSVLGCGWHRVSACDARHGGDRDQCAAVDRQIGHCHTHRHGAECGSTRVDEPARAVRMCRQVAAADRTAEQHCSGETRPAENCPADCPCQHNCPGVGTYLDNGKARIEIVLDAALRDLAAVGPASPINLSDAFVRMAEAPARIPILPVRLHLAHQVLLI